LPSICSLSLSPVPVDGTAAVPSSAEDSGNAKKKARLLQLILDQAFIDENNKSSSRTLREMLSGDDKVKVQDLVVSHVSIQASRSISDERSSHTSICLQQP
jgi:hypothetical protein